MTAVFKMIDSSVTLSYRPMGFTPEPDSFLKMVITNRLVKVLARYIV